MASQDVVLSQPDVAAVPTDYDIAAAAEIMPLAVKADYDGSAAAGAYMPTLEILAPSGQVVARCPTTTQVGAGSSAEVTWAPFLGRGGAGAVPSGVPAPQAFLFDYTLTADTASIDTLTSGPYAGLISQAFYLLEVWIYVRTDEVTTGSSIKINVNGDAGANYDRIFLSGFTNVATPAGATSVVVQNGTTAWTPAAVCGASSTANYFSVVRISLPSYATTVGYKTGEAVHAHPNAVAGVDPSGMLIAPQTLGYRSTSGISRMVVTPNTAGVKLKAGSRLLIYGR